MSDTIAQPMITDAEQLALLRRMHEIRAFEDTCHRLFAQGTLFPLDGRASV